MAIDIKARLVDERDTKWEEDRQDYRVFIISTNNGEWEAYDIEQQTLSNVTKWAHANILDANDQSYSIAIKLLTDEGPGLLWLTPDPSERINSGAIR